MIQTSSPPKRVLHIDEHPVCQIGLRAMLDSLPAFQLSSTASTALIEERGSDATLVILEIGASQTQGIAAIRNLRRALPNTPILVLSRYDERIYADRCLKAGAAGFLMKTAPLSELQSAIESVAGGSLYVSERVKSLMVRRMVNPEYPSSEPSFHSLSDRELLIVEQIGLSKNNKEIAQTLQISVKTIESHRSRIKAKLQLDSPQELMRFALRLHAS